MWRVVVVGLMFPLKSQCIMNLKTQGFSVGTGGNKKLCRNTGPYGRPAGPWSHRLCTLPSFLLHQCSMLLHLAFLYLPHAYLNNESNCKDGEIITKSSGKYANRKLYKLREGWENKDNQEHYQQAPGVQALEAEGEHVPGGGGLGELLVWYAFLFMNLLSRAPENSDKWSSNTCDSGGKKKLGVSHIYPLPCSFNMFVLIWQL